MEALTLNCPGKKVPCLLKRIRSSRSTATRAQLARSAISQPGTAIGGQHFDFGLNHLATAHGYVLVHLGTEIDTHGYHGHAGEARTIAIFADENQARFTGR